MENWISMDDEKPEHGQKVFYYFKYTGVNRGYYERAEINLLEGKKLICDVFQGDKGFLCDDVTHWMPDNGQVAIPKPPIITK